MKQHHNRICQETDTRFFIKLFMVGMIVVYFMFVFVTKEYCPQGQIELWGSYSNGQLVIQDLRYKPQPKTLIEIAPKKHRVNGFKLYIQRNVE